MSEKKTGGKGGKRKRTPKRSLGIHGGGGKVTLTRVQKVLLGGGTYASTKPMETGQFADNWKGLETVRSPWDPIQARENRRLYPHLF